MKATEQHFPMVMLIMLYKVVLTLESVDAVFKCDNFFSCGAVYNTAQGIFYCQFNFFSLEMRLKFLRL